jgi:hypothetical protein
MACRLDVESSHLVGFRFDPTFGGRDLIGGGLRSVVRSHGPRPVLADVPQRTLKYRGGKFPEDLLRVLRVDLVQSLDDQVVGRDRTGLIHPDKVFNHGALAFRIRSNSSSARSQA